jgi:hypothetical protein
MEFSFFPLPLFLSTSHHAGMETLRKWFSLLKGRFPLPFPPLSLHQSTQRKATYSFECFFKYWE